MNDNFIETVNATIKNMDAVAAQNDADRVAAINCQRCGAMLTTANSGTETADGGMRLDVEMCNDCERISAMCERVLASAEAEWAEQAKAPAVCTACGVAITPENDAEFAGAEMCLACMEHVPVCEVCDELAPSAKARENPSVVACDSCWENRPGHGDLADAEGEADQSASEYVAREANRVQCNMGCGTVATCEHSAAVLALEPAGFVMVLDCGKEQCGQVLVFTSEEDALASKGLIMQYYVEGDVAVRYCDVCDDGDNMEPTGVTCRENAMILCDACYASGKEQGII